jgi:plasmid stabilization system protein ParE
VRYTITRNDDVRFDVAAILDFVGNYAGFVTGRRKVAEISRSIDSLSEYPHRGARREDVQKNLRILPCTEKAVICFTVNDDTHTVRIICVTYAGQDWQAIARSRD